MSTNMKLSKYGTPIFASIAICAAMSSLHLAVANHNNSNASNTAIIENRQDLAINLRDMPLLKQVTVTSRQPVLGRQLPNESSAIVFSYSYGGQLDVIEELREWYGIRDIRVNYEDVAGKPSYPAKKVYVKKVQTGQKSEIELIEDDLNILAYLSVAGDYQHFEEGKALNRYLKFEIIDKALFEQKRPLAVDFLSKNKVIKKKNGVLAIPTTSKVVTFTDNDVDNDGRQTFEYVGQLDSLNQHLVSGSYWESGDYSMIDKGTGAVTQTFIDYPYIAPNKKYIISAYPNPYEQYTDFELYKVDDGKVTPVMLVGFKNWMPTVEPTDIFWAKDGYLYLAVIHSAVFWTADGSLNDKHQYIRIKVDM